MNNRVLKTLWAIVAVAVMVSFTASCSKSDNGPEPDDPFRPGVSSAHNLNSFKLLSSYNPTLKGECTATIASVVPNNTNLVLLTAPEGFDLTNVIPNLEN